MVRRIDASLDRAGLPPLTRSAWVEIDIDVLTQNARALLAHATPAALGVVVKADGYGHGLEMSARCAVAGGATWLCVADGGEAVRLRNDGYTGRVFVLYPVPSPTVASLAGLGVDLTVGSVDQARELAAMRHGSTASIHLEIDTGMTRGGVHPREAVEAATAIVEGGTTRLAGIWTHLAAPEDPADIESQMRRFGETLRDLAGHGIEPEETHALATGGLLAVDAHTTTFTRLGLGYYGYDPDAGLSLPPDVRPALAVRAHPVRIADVETGSSVGYAGTWTADRPSRIATLPLGYADGWARSSSPGSEVLVDGVRAPVVGRISSDSMAVDVTDVPDAGHDSEFTLLGSSGSDFIGADAVAEVRGTISWEVLQQLGSRLSRVYVSDGDAVASRAESIVELELTGAVPDYDAVVSGPKET